MTETTIIAVPAQGPRGPKGDQGDQGDVGLRGIAGPIGQQGLTGETGDPGAGYLATSATSADLTDSGIVVLTSQPNLAYSAGARARVSSRGNPGVLMEGTVTDYGSLSGVITIQMDSKVGGPLTAADWNINITGSVGSVAGSLGTIATQNANNVNITGGAIIGMVDPAVSSGVATKNYVDNSFGSGVPTTRTITAAGLLTGGGDLSANRTITLTKALTADATTGTDDTKAMTAIRTAEAIAALQLIRFIASQAEAEAGTENSKGMTALRVAQAIAIGAGPRRLATVTPTGGSFVFTGLNSTYSKYRFELLNITVNVGSAGSFMQVSTDGGSTWQNTTYFFMGRQQTTNAGADDGYTTGGGIVLHHSNNTQAANSPICGSVMVTTPSDVLFVKDVEVSTRYTDSSGTNCSYSGHGFWNSTTAINAVKFANNALNGFVSGTIKMYGIP